MEESTVNDQFCRRYGELVRLHKTGITKHQVIDCNSIKSALKHFDQIVLEYVGRDGCIKNSELFDYIFVASGYEFSTNERLLAPLANILRYSQNKISINSGCKVRLSPNIVSEKCGIWLASGTDDDTGDVLAHLATKTSKILQSMLASTRPKVNIQKQEETGMSRTVEYARL
jgi:hypothetical protein